MAFLAVTRLLTISMWSPTGKVLWRSLRALSLHLRLQDVERIVVGSPFGPCMGVKLTFTPQVRGTLNTNL